MFRLKVLSIEMDLAKGGSQLKGVSLKGEVQRLYAIPFEVIALSRSTLPRIAFFTSYTYWQFMALGNNLENYSQWRSTQFKPSI